MLTTLEDTVLGSNFCFQLSYALLQAIEAVEHFAAVSFDVDVEFFQFFGDIFDGDCETSDRFSIGVVAFYSAANSHGGDSYA